MFSLQVRELGGQSDPRVWSIKFFTFSRRSQVCLSSSCIRECRKDDLSETGKVMMGGVSLSGGHNVEVMKDAQSQNAQTGQFGLVSSGIRDSDVGGW